MTARHLLLACRYRWRTALLAWIATAGIVLLAAAVLMPPQYRASSEILIEDDAREAAAPPAQESATSRLATQADVVRSERVMLNALRAMGLQGNRQLRDRWSSQTGGHGDYEAWVVERLQKKTDVRPARDSKVLYVSHSAADPRFAADFVNALVTAYKDTALELRLQPARQYSAFYEDRVRQFRERLQNAQKLSSDFHRLNGITTTDQKYDVEDARLAELSAQVVGLQARAGEAQRRQEEAAANPSAMEEVLRDPTVTSLAAALALQETRHNEITEKLGSRHPQVIESNSVIAALTARLDSAKRRAAASFRGGSNVAASQLAERTKALEAQRVKVLGRRDLRDQARLLQNEVEVAQREFDAVVARLSKASLDTNAPQANVSILKLATVPAVTVSASAAARVGVAGVAGLVLALLLLTVVESRDRRLRDTQDVQALLDQPVLTVLGRRQAGRNTSQRHPLVARYRPALTQERLHAAR